MVQMCAFVCLVLETARKYTWKNINAYAFILHQGL